MDSWYAAQKLIAFVEQLGKIYYCPLKLNRLVDHTGGQVGAFFYQTGFCQGTAGIGYELLRLGYPDLLPSVLLWQ